MESMREWGGDGQHIFEEMGIGFGTNDLFNIQRPQTDALVIREHIGGYNVERVFVDVMFMGCF